MRDADIVAAARMVRRDLLSRAADMVEILDTLLLRADGGERVGDEILSLLTEDPEIRVELQRLLPVDEDTLRSPEYAGLPGLGSPSPEIVFGCTDCAYEYPVFEAGEPIPDRCPRGHGPLIRRS